ncbi:hypothetical protein CR513_02575, partial [Mucuna pruriens]
MEDMIESLEQQNQELRGENQELKGEMTQIREQMNKLYKLFTQKTTVNVVPAQGTSTHPPGYAPQPYGMPYGKPYGENTNTEDQQECQRQEQVEKFGGGQTQGQRTTPRATVYYHPPQNPSVIVAPPPVSNEKLSSLEERLRAIKGTGSHGLDATDLCLVLGIILPANFKVPKFEKYKDSGHVKTWRDLAEAFIRQYKYNEDMAPDCS